MFHNTASIRSHIDTTAVQAVIDTRNEVERWTDAPVEVSTIVYSATACHSLNVV